MPIGLPDCSRSRCRRYVAVGIPVAVVGCVVAFDWPAPGPRAQGAQMAGLRWVLPWLLVALLAAGLEGLGLALGGRSTTVPTMSTVIDHGLAWHALRLALLAALLLSELYSNLVDQRWVSLTRVGAVIGRSRAGRLLLVAAWAFTGW